MLIPFLLKVTPKYVGEGTCTQTLGDDADMLHLHPASGPTGTVVIYEAAPSV